MLENTLGICSGDVVNWTRAEDDAQARYWGFIWAGGAKLYVPPRGGSAANANSWAGGHTRGRRKGWEIVNSRD